MQQVQTQLCGSGCTHASTFKALGAPGMADFLNIYVYLILQSRTTANERMVWKLCQSFTPFLEISPFVLISSFSPQDGHN
jgi:hypothetical protein